jgi:hypothetical protein
MFDSIKRYIEKKFIKKNKIHYKLISEDEDRRIYSVNGHVYTDFKNLDN